MEERKVNVAPLFDIIDKISVACPVYKENFKFLKYVISNTMDDFSFYEGFNYYIGVLDTLKAFDFLCINQCLDLMVVSSLHPGQNTPYLYDSSGNEYYLDSDARRHYTREEG